MVFWGACRVDLTERDTSRWGRSVEALLEIGAQLVGVYLVFVIVGCIAPDDAGALFFSLLVLPVLYILKDGYLIYEPFCTKVEIGSSYASVKRGWPTKVTDQLELQNIENIELVSTLLGRKWGYGTLRLYAFGGSVELPYLMGAEKIKTEIEASIAAIKAGKARSNMSE